MQNTIIYIIGLTKLQINHLTEVHQCKKKNQSSFEVQWLK